MPVRRPSDGMSDRPAQLRQRDVDAIQRQARRVQVGMPISGNPIPFRGRGAPGPNGGCIPAIVTQAITAASGTTAGTGKVQLYYLDKPDDTAATADADNNNVDVKNWYTASGTIPVGTHVWVAVSGPAYWLIGADC